MDENLKLILEEFEKYKGQHVINHRTVERLIAVSTDDSDYYWVYWTGQKLRFSTCCGSFIPLKGKITDEEYNEFVMTARLNDADILGEIDTVTWEYKNNAEEVKKRVEEVDDIDRFLTEVCWDLN